MDTKTFIEDEPRKNQRPSICQKNNRSENQIRQREDYENLELPTGTHSVKHQNRKMEQNQRHHETGARRDVFDLSLSLLLDLGWKQRRIEETGSKELETALPRLLQEVAANAERVPPDHAGDGTRHRVDLIGDLVGGVARRPAREQLADEVADAVVGGVLREEPALGRSTDAHQRHRPVLTDEQVGAGITPGLIRVSVGLEDPNDLVADFLHAIQPEG